MEEDRVGVVSGAEVNDPAGPDAPGQTAAERLAGLIPRNQENCLWLGDRERFGEARPIGQDERRDPLRDGVVGGDHVDLFGTGGLTPGLGLAVLAHGQTERFAGERRMKGDQSQAARADAVGDGAGAVIGNVFVAEPAPPDEDVGGVELGVAQAGIGFAETGGGNLKLWEGSKGLSDRAIDVVGVDAGGCGSLAPDA